MNQKSLGSIKSYCQLFYQSLKMANHYGIDPLIIPFDFVWHYLSKLDKKVSKIVMKMMNVLKQFIYELSFETNTHNLKTIVIALDAPNS